MVGRGRNAELEESISFGISDTDGFVDGSGPVRVIHVHSGGKPTVVTPTFYLASSVLSVLSLLSIYPPPFFLPRGLRSLVWNRPGSRGRAGLLNWLFSSLAAGSFFPVLKDFEGTGTTMNFDISRRRQYERGVWF